MSAQELTKKVRELKELKVMAEELAAEITAIEDEIKTVMTAQGTDEITVVGSDICNNRIAADKRGGGFKTFIKMGVVA